MSRALIVDDESTTRETLRDFVPWSELGITGTDLASNGEEALAIWEAKRPDLVVTDLRMPRMDGVELALRLRALAPDLPIIFLSGYSDVAYLKTAITVGVVEYIDKPVDIATLSFAVRKALDRAAAAESARRARPWLRQSLARALSGGDASGIAASDLEPFRKGAWALAFYPRPASDMAKGAETGGNGPQARLPGSRELADYLNGDSLHPKPATSLPSVPAPAPDADAGTAPSSTLPSIFNMPRAAEPADEGQALLFLPAGAGASVSAGEKALRAELPAFLDAIEAAFGWKWWIGIGCCTDFPATKAAEAAKVAARGRARAPELREFWSSGSMAAADARADLAVAWINEHFFETSISVSSVAGKVGLSDAYLCTLFKAGTGRTIRDYITALRIARAKEILAGTNLKTQAVALAVGFRDVDYFCGIFKRETGMTPGEWRSR